MQAAAEQMSLCPHSSVLPFLSPLFPLPAPSSQNESGTAVTADVIAPRHHWCYDNSKSSLSLALSHSQVHFGLLLNVPNYAPQHIKTATFQPLSPFRTFVSFSGVLFIQILLF